MFIVIPLLNRCCWILSVTYRAKCTYTWCVENVMYMFIASIIRTCTCVILWHIDCGHKTWLIPVTKAIILVTMLLISILYHLGNLMEWITLARSCVHLHLLHHMEGNFGAAKIWWNWQVTKNLPIFHHLNFYTSVES